MFEPKQQSPKKSARKAFTPAPKFGMPTEMFKECIKKDDRVPKLTDKRIIEAREEEERRRREANKKEDPGFSYNDLKVFRKALGDAVHATRAEP